MELFEDEDGLIPSIIWFGGGGGRATIARTIWASSGIPPVYNSYIYTRRYDGIEQLVMGVEVMGGVGLIQYYNCPDELVYICFFQNYTFKKSCKNIFKKMTTPLKRVLDCPARETRNLEKSLRPNAYV